jgi:E1A-binding protein p400
LHAETAYSLAFIFRYDSVIVPREEGKILYDSNPKKQKKTKSMYKLPPQTKTNRPMRTSQLYIQDNNGTYTHLYTQCFETIKAVSNKRTPTVRPQQIENPTMRNPKHAAVLADIGIVYDQPLTPIEVATRRAERIAKEKQKTQAAAVSVPCAVSLVKTDCTWMLSHVGGQVHFLGSKSFLIC